ncbi:hypothetical protein KM043_002424 [Ampulex compressa]|nr:hypothetical protein KM043_002424 [Ampulex compressa]
MHKYAERTAAPPVPPRRKKRRMNPPAAVEAPGPLSVTNLAKPNQRRLPPPPPPPEASQRRKARPAKNLEGPNATGSALAAGKDEEASISRKKEARTREEDEEGFRNMKNETWRHRDTRNGKMEDGTSKWEARIEKEACFPNFNGSYRSEQSDKKYPPLFFTLDDFQNVMASSSRAVECLERAAVLLEDSRESSRIVEEPGRSSMMVEDSRESSRIMEDPGREQLENSLTIVECPGDSSMIVEDRENSSMIVDHIVERSECSSNILKPPKRSSIIVEHLEISSMECPKKSSMIVELPEISSTVPDDPERSSILVEPPENSSRSTEYLNEKEGTFLEDSLEAGEEVCFRVTTTNLPFGKCLDGWRTSFEDVEFSRQAETRDNFVFEDYIDRSSRLNIRRSIADFDVLDSNDFPPVRIATKVRFVIDPPRSLPPELDGNARIVSVDSAFEDEAENKTDRDENSCGNEPRSTSLADEFGDVPFVSILKKKSSQPVATSNGNCCFDSKDVELIEHDASASTKSPSKISSTCLDSNDINTTEEYASGLMDDRPAIKLEDTTDTIENEDVEVECKGKCSLLSSSKATEGFEKNSSCTLQRSENSTTKSVEIISIIPKTEFSKLSYPAVDKFAGNFHGQKNCAKESVSPQHNPRSKSAFNLVGEQEKFAIERVSSTVLAEDENRTFERIQDFEPRSENLTDTGQLSTQESTSQESYRDATVASKRRILVKDAFRNFISEDDHCCWKGSRDSMDEHVTDDASIINNNATHDFTKDEQILNRHIRNLEKQVPHKPHHTLESPNNINTSMYSDKRNTTNDDERISNIYADYPAYNETKTNKADLASLKEAPTIPDSSEDSLPDGNVTVPVNVMRNSFLETMLSDDLSEWEVSDRGTTNDPSKASRASTIDPEVERRENELASRLNDAIKMDVEIQKILKESQELARRADLMASSPKQAGKIASPSNRSAGEAKSEVLNELLSNFSNMKLKAVTEEADREDDARNVSSKFEEAKEGVWVKSQEESAGQTSPARPCARRKIEETWNGNEHWSNYNESSINSERMDENMNGNLEFASRIRKEGGAYTREEEESFYRSAGAKINERKKPQWSALALKTINSEAWPNDSDTCLLPNLVNMLLERNMAKDKNQSPGIIPEDCNQRTNNSDALDDREASDKATTKRNNPNSERRRSLSQLHRESRKENGALRQPDDDRPEKSGGGLSESSDNPIRSRSNDIRPESYSSSKPFSGKPSLKGPRDFLREKGERVGTRSTPRLSPENPRGRSGSEVFRAEVMMNQEEDLEGTARSSEESLDMTWPLSSGLEKTEEDPVLAVGPKNRGREAPASAVKCAIARKTPATRCNNTDNNRAVTPVAVSKDQSRDMVTITPGRVRSFVEYYEVRGEATAEAHSKIIDRERAAAWASRREDLEDPGSLARIEREIACLEEEEEEEEEEDEDRVENALQPEAGSIHWRSKGSFEQEEESSLVKCAPPGGPGGPEGGTDFEARAQEASTEEGSSRGQEVAAQIATGSEENSGINRYVSKSETPRLVFYCTV